MTREEAKKKLSEKKDYSGLEVIGSSKEKDVYEDSEVIGKPSVDINPSIKSQLLGGK